MATQFEIDCALMSGRAYQSTRESINQFPVPDGWVEKLHKEDDSGFEAISFQRGDEIVISFAGTYDKDLDGDISADIGLATGFGSAQLLQATEYYLQVKAANATNPNVAITLTGHSLGGGLAALVGVFFGVKSVTFDQAPFAESAEENLLTPDVAANLKNDLSLKGYTEHDLENLNNFLQRRESTGGIPNANLISNIRVDGEFLSCLPLNKVFTTIGNTETVLEHGPYFQPSIDLHSITLLTAFLEDVRFRQVTYKLTDMLGMLFDENLFAYDTDKSDPNFLEHLIRHQIGLRDADGVVTLASDAMLTRFTADLWKIAQDGGLTLTNKDIAKTLTAFAMQMYYEKETPSDKTLFDDNGVAGGGIHFNRTDVADSLNAALGFELYFTNYLYFLPGNENEAITQQLPALLDWYIQAGYKAMEAQAGDQRAFMLGYDKGDNLFGGTAGDVLVGGKGTDLLMGGKGDDILIGGDGNDFYLYRIGDGNDRIIDNERSNRLIIKETDGSTVNDFGQLYASGSNRWTSADGHFTLAETTTWTLHMPDGGSIDLGNTFQNGDFGINLAELPAITTTNTIVGDLNPLTGSADQYDVMGFVVAQNVLLDSLGNVVTAPSVSLPGRRDYLYDSAVNDRIQAGGGDDIIAAIRGGNDILEGGTGNDLILDTGGDNQLFGENYGAMADLVNAGEVAESISVKGDLLSAGGGNDQLYGSNKNDALFGGGGNDLIVGGGGDDIILADASVSAVSRDWSVDNSSFNSLGYVDAAVGGADNIYGGMLCFADSYQTAAERRGAA